jgi:hypothetical protein
MAKQRGWVVEIEVYLLWITAIALGFWLALQMRTCIELSLVMFYVRDRIMLVRPADAMDKFSFPFIICAWVVGIVLVESYFRNGVKNHSLVKRFARIFGPTLLLLFVVDLANLLMQGINTAIWSQWLVLAGELLGGLLITFYGYKALTPAISP